MSIDHGKVLALTDAPPIPASLIGADPSRVWAAAWETLHRALAQPAEAVESPYFENETALINFLDGLTELDGEGGDGHLKWRPAQDAIAGICARADAAQGAVAALSIALDTQQGTRVTLHRTRAKEILAALTHPQAAPAQGDGREWVAGYMQGANDYVGGAQGALDQDELRADAEMARRHYAAELAAAPSQEGES